MKKTLLALSVTTLFTLCLPACCDDWDFGQYYTSGYNNHYDDYNSSSGASAFSTIRDTRPPSGYKQDTYGPGVHSDPYGRPVSFEVIGQPGANTNFLEIKPNAYGLGVHSDQYGRAIRDEPYYR